MPPPTPNYEEPLSHFQICLSYQSLPTPTVFAHNSMMRLHLTTCTLIALKRSKRILSPAYNIARPSHKRNSLRIRFRHADSNCLP